MDFLTIISKSVPQSHKGIINSFKETQWKEAITSEIDFILQNHIWEHMDLPLGRKPLG